MFDDLSDDHFELFSIIQTFANKYYQLSFWNEFEDQRSLMCFPSTTINISIVKLAGHQTFYWVWWRNFL